MEGLILIFEGLRPSNFPQIAFMMNNLTAFLIVPSFLRILPMYVMNLIKMMCGTKYYYNNYCHYIHFLKVEKNILNKYKY